MRARQAYNVQKSGAKRRGISWEMTFVQWWGIWEKSGHYKDRGNRCGQYVMCRDGDKGPYKPGNVSIKTTAENIREWFDSERERKALRRRGGYIHSPTPIHADNLWMADPLEILLRDEDDTEGFTS